MPTYQTPAASRTVRRRSRRSSQNRWAQLLRGLLCAIGVTILCVLLFAFLMQWLRPSDSLIRIVNQLIKLGAIFAGVRVMLAKNRENGMLSGALLGLLYMAAGIALYALLSGQQLPFTAYLSDIAMGIAGGGICGALLSGMK